jgi:hypothetical protein
MLLISIYSTARTVLFGAEFMYAYAKRRGIVGAAPRMRVET